MHVCTKLVQKSPTLISDRREYILWSMLVCVLVQRLWPRSTGGSKTSHIVRRALELPPCSSMLLMLVTSIAFLVLPHCVPDLSNRFVTGDIGF
jgi:hypothetical protein